MGRGGIIAGLVALFSTAALSISSDPLSTAAEYYFTRHDFRQALQLWTEVFRRQPDNVTAALRVAELKLMFEGRLASRDVVLKFLETKGESLPLDTRRGVRDRLARLQSSFLTDDAQSTFLQALPRMAHKDFTGALTLLNQAFALDRGNLRILREKAKAEKALGAYDRAYESWKVAAESDPFDAEVLDNLAESHAHYGFYDRVVALFKRDAETLTTPRQRTAYGFALAETGETVEATMLLQGLVELEKQTGFHPIVYEVLGRSLAAKKDASLEASQYLERFLSISSRPESTLIDGWDPYRSVDRREAAQKLLLSLKSQPG